MSNWKAWGVSLDTCLDLSKLWSRNPSELACRTVETRGLMAPAAPCSSAAITNSSTNSDGTRGRAASWTITTFKLFSGTGQHVSFSVSCNNNVLIMCLIYTQHVQRCHNLFGGFYGPWKQKTQQKNGSDFTSVQT